MDNETYNAIHEALSQHVIRCRINLENWKAFHGTMTPTEVLAHTAFAEIQLQKAEEAKTLFIQHCQ